MCIFWCGLPAPHSLTTHLFSLPCVHPRPAALAAAAKKNDQGLSINQQKGGEVWR
jgi:hypothetical protein